MISVDTEVIIGNYIIELVLQRKYQFTIEDLRQLDIALSPKLTKLDYHFKPLFFHVFDFADAYPDFVEIRVDIIYIKKDVSIDTLIRYFRLGCPKDLIKTIEDVIEK